MLESVLDTKAHPVDLHPIIAGLDDPALSTANDPRVTYRKCPVCVEVMNRFNFGRQSGVILDRCRAHGVWLEGGEFRRIAEWWHAGGGAIHLRHDTPRVMPVAIPAVIVPPPSTGSAIPDWLGELPVEAAVEVALEGLLAVISSITD